MALTRILFVAFIATIPLQDAQAQYFGKNALQLPFVGWMGLGTTAKDFQLPGAEKWSTSDQVQLGFGYMHSLVGYRLWWITQSAVAFGYAEPAPQNSSQIVIGLNVSSGLRYNFLQEYVRPFIAGQAEYLHFFNRSSSAADGPGFWLGVLVGPGVECFVGDDMSLQLETGAHALTDFHNPFRFAWSARLSYVLYF